MQLAPTRPTLIDSLIPGKSLTKDIALIIGFSLLVPGTRHLIQKRTMARLERRIQEGAVQVVTGGELWSRSPHATPPHATSPDPIPPDSMSPTGSPGE